MVLQNELADLADLICFGVAPITLYIQPSRNAPLTKYMMTSRDPLFKSHVYQQLPNILKPNVCHCCRIKNSL